MDQDALIFTCNIFHRNADNTDSFVHGWVGVVGKARTYNGLTAFFDFFTPAGGNIAPPIVSPDAFSQANGNTYLLSAPPAGSALTEYRLTNTSRPIDTTFTMMSTASVGAYMFPPNAPQPGTPALLDTSDARIVDTVFQVDASPATLFAVHSINFSGFATPRYYEINAVTGGVVQEGLFFASGTSSGWNASIATNSTKNAAFPSRDVYVNWSSTDANNGANLSERISGRCHGDPPGVISNDADVADSLSFYLLGRTGDYSSVSVDPDDGTAIVYNETFLDPSTWNTHVEKISFPVACP
jgi:hypothetical protein